GVRAQGGAPGYTSRSARRPPACARTGGALRMPRPVGVGMPEAYQPPTCGTRAWERATVARPVWSWVSDTNPEAVSDELLSLTLIEVASGAAFWIAASRVDFTDAAKEPQPADLTSSRKVTTPSSA